MIDIDEDDDTLFGNCINVHKCSGKLREHGLEFRQVLKLTVKGSISFSFYELVTTSIETTHGTHARTTSVYTRDCIGSTNPRK